MSRVLRVVSGLVLLTALAAPQAGAQMVRHTGSDGNLVIVHELGIVIGPQQDSDGLQVLTLLPDAAEKSDVTLEEGDLLLMIDGRRVREMAALREAYDGAEVGRTIKLGFRRGDERFLASFEKEQQPEGEMRMVMLAGPGHDMGDIHPLPEFGALLSESDDRVVVAMELPTDEPALRQDDVLKTINGKEIGTLAEFREAYESLAVGEDVVLVVARGGDELSVTRAKIDASGMVRVRRGH